MLEQHLVLAKEHIARGEKIIGRQKQLIEELKRDDHATLAAKASELLEHFIA